MKCPKCKVECNPYMHYESIGECPKCKGLFTTASGDDVAIYKGKVE